MLKPMDNGQRRGGKKQDHANAEEVGLLALLFLTADGARIDRFLALTGSTIDQLRAGAHTALLQAAILDYFLRDESLLLEFTGNAGIPPDSIARVRAALADQF